MRLGSIEREYLRALVDEGGVVVAWKFFERLHYNAYPYFYFVQRLVRLQKKGLIHLMRGGPRGGLSLHITPEGMKAASAED